MGFSFGSCSCKPNICGSIVIDDNDNTAINPSDPNQKKNNNDQMKKTIIKSMNEPKEDIYACQPQDEINRSDDNIFMNFVNAQN